MKLSLTITGSAQALAAILAALPDDTSVTDMGNAPSTSIGTGTPVESASPPSVPNTAAPIPAASNPPMMPTPITSDSVPLPDVGSDDSDGGAPNATPPEVDSRGMPWDERIHAGTKALNNDGSWRNKRGVDKDLLAQVEAELLGKGQQHVAPPQPVIMPATIPVHPPVQQPAPMAQPVPAPAPAPMQEAVNAAMGMPTPIPAPQPMPQPAPAPVAQPTPAPATTAAEPLDFTAFMARLSPLFSERDAQGAPLVHADYLAQLTGEISTAFQQPLNAFTDIQGNQPMIDYAIALLSRDGRWR